MREPTKHPAAFPAEQFLTMCQTRVAAAAVQMFLAVYGVL
jgi:hypothetical protein